jgi:hypothetical protein
MKGKIVQDPALLGHFAKTDVRYWQRTVFRQTYTHNDCYTIFIDSKENNPSLRTRVRPFLTKNRTKDPRLSDELARIYSDRSPYWPDAAVVGEFSAEDQRALIAKNEKANAERRLAFERILNRLARDWARLERASQHFPVFRTHFIAHSILECDAATERYAYPQMPKPKELCATIEKILPIITRSIATLAFILGVGAEKDRRVRAKGERRCGDILGTEEYCHQQGPKWRHTMTPLDQQISESRDLFKHLLHRYAWLANTFALLAPMVNDIVPKYNC